MAFAECIRAKWEERWWKSHYTESINYEFQPSNANQPCDRVKMKLDHIVYAAASSFSLLDISKKQIKYDWREGKKPTNKLADLSVLDHEILESKNSGLTVNLSQQQPFKYQSIRSAFNVHHHELKQLAHIFTAPQYYYDILSLIWISIYYLKINSCILNWFSSFIFSLLFSGFRNRCAALIMLAIISGFCDARTNTI